MSIIYSNFYLIRLVLSAYIDTHSIFCNAQQIKKYNNSIEDMLNADVSVLKGISKEKIQELLKKLSENENE